MAYDGVPLSTAGDGARERIKTAKARADKLFQDFALFRSYCQTVAEIFWPERANFTIDRTPGADMQSGLYTSTPQVMRRDLSNRIGSVIRAPSQDWFKLVARPDELMTDDAVRQWCDTSTRTLRSIIYDRRTNYAKTMAVGDNDFVTFGNAVSWAAVSEDQEHMVFRPCHLRNCAWAENEYGNVDEIYEKLKMNLGQVARLFGRNNLPKPWLQRLDRKGGAGGLEDVQVMRGVYPIRQGDYKEGSKPARKWKYVVCYWADDAGCHEDELALRERFSRTFPYNVRRWQVMGDEPFGRSPVTTVALADAYTLNVAEMATLKAIEFSADPMRWAAHEAVVGDIEFRAGGVTYVDFEDMASGRDPFGTFESGDSTHSMDYIEKKQVGMALQFFETLWKFPDREMTAYEASERMQMIVQEATPVFQPMEDDNSRQMDTVFDLSLDRGAFQPPPDTLLQNGSATWEFETPVSTSLRKVRSEKARTILMEAGEFKAAFPTFGDHIDLDKLEREYLQGRGPESWIKPVDQVEKERVARQEQIAQERGTEQALQIADTAAKARPENLKQLTDESEAA